MKKLLLSAAVAAALGTVSVGAQAALVNGDTLNIGSGSYFGMEVAPGYVINTNLVNNAGIVLGTTQSTGTSHGGAPDGTENLPAGAIDQPWLFFSNTGMDFTVSPTNVTSASGNTASVDFSGWRVTWNGIPAINMGGGTQVYNGTTYDNGTGVASVTCSAGCGNGDTYTLDYAAVVPQGDPSNFGGVHYTLHLTGTVSAVPVPAAVWLFGSGLVGLVGVARRKKSV